MSDLQGKGRTVLRVSQEFREFVELVSSESDLETRQGLFADLDVLDEIGNWLASVVPISLTLSKEFVPTNSAGTYVACARCTAWMLPGQDHICKRSVTA